jgi:sulfoxide reductase heme-binding subunit YedZ
VSLLTAWLCMTLLAAALLIGPWRARQTGKPTLNFLPRRDLGIWAGLTGLAHLIAATEVVMTPAYFRTYITSTDVAALPGLAGWIGTAAILAGYLIGLVLLLLLLLSNNTALRRLGPDKWKRYQRWAYPAFVVTAIHGLIFQVIENRIGGWLPMLLAILVLVIVARRSATQRIHAENPLRN